MTGTYRCPHPNPKPTRIGDITESQVHCIVCLICHFVIDLGLCSDHCDLDGTYLDDRPVGTTVKKIYQRRDELVAEEVI